ncbi:MAG TPA: ferrous iron transporter B [Caulobacteraceae bacterium]|jgi:ferrous iron transport protein B
MTTADLAPTTNADDTLASRPLRVALAGVPNCGKTALFNALTGARQKVANYAGVTVERKEGQAAAPSGRKLAILDLPGTYSLRARSPDEMVTRDAVLGQLAGESAPDVIVCVADATSLRVALRLALEMKSAGRPMVLALNMIDIAIRQGLDIDVEGLASDLGVPIVSTVATRRRGVDALTAAIESAAASTASASTWHEPSSSELRALHREAERLIRAHVQPPKRPDTWTGRLDSVLLHPVGGLAVLLVLLFFMFQAVFSWAQPVMDMITAGFSWLSAALGQALPDGLLKSFLCDGLIAGVGSVVVFLPQIMILFLFIILLEDVGYMARAAFLMDRIMGRAGLHGRAFIPLLSSHACAIPGIMATRVIDQKRDRLTTILVAPLTTCSARIPIYTLIISAFVPNHTLFGWVSEQGLVMLGLYVSGISSALIVAFVIRTVFWRGASEPFLMELPAYKLPDPLNVARLVLQRAEIFLRRAGTIILSMMVIVWALAKIPLPPAGAKGPAIDYSFAGMIGHALQPLLQPIGFSWQMSVALIPGMAAREVAVGALGTVYAVSGGDDNTALLGHTLAGHWSLASALAFLAWYVFAPQCASTLGVVKRETNSWRWPAIMFGYMITLAYIAAFITYRTALALGAG